MLSKYILNSNWIPLSSNYKFDKNVDLFNTDITVTGNLNLTYTSYLSNISDYANNNYSLVFLTKKSKISRIFDNKLPTVNTNKLVCLLGNKIQEGGLISEETTFLRLSGGGLQVNNILNLTDNNYFEIDFITSNEALLVTKKDRNFLYVCVDDLNVKISVIQKKELETLTDFELEKIKLYYIYDNERKGIVLYRIIQDSVYIISVDNSGTVVLRRSNLRDLTVNDIFNLLRIKDLPSLKNNLSWVNYTTDIDKENLNINQFTDVNNNFIAHIEYDNIVDTSVNSNFLTLKNQLNARDRAIKNPKDDFRDYKTIIGGGNREQGYENLSIGYKTNYYPVILKSDKITWFHIPHNNINYRPSIASAPFIENGAIAGSAPIYSDKIFKKAANYANTSNMGKVNDVEETGIWLCAWLSGGNNKKVWVDRFFNESSFTPYDALRYQSNVSYTPEFENKRGEGITDIPSNMTLEPGAWYAYSRVGKNTSSKILSGLNNVLLSDGFNSFNTINKSPKPFNIDSEGAPIYDFKNDAYGVISTEKLKNFNNFSISFFASRDNWNVNREYQIFGNYLDYGFGLFNNNFINPINFYINEKILYILNNRYNNILTIDCNFYLSGQDFKIATVFKREFNGNFHILTTNNNLLEFNSNGTLVDSLSISKRGDSRIRSTTNNSNYGVILYEDNSAIRINLYSNITQDITNSLIRTKNTINYPNILIDTFNFVYVIDGVMPILKNTNIYYKDINDNCIKVYNINDTTISNYISSTKPIFGYNFNNSAETYVLYQDSVDIYNSLGVYFSSFKIQTNTSSITSITSFELSFQNLNDKQQGNIRFIDNNNKNYIFNINNRAIKKIDNIYNANYSLTADLIKYNFDTCNYNYIQSVLENAYPLPNYNFRVRLFNQFNYEDVKFLNVNILGESLNRGTHHFVITLDVINGYLKVYVDNNLYTTQYFEPAKYSFSNLFNNTVIFGSLPFYGGLLYSDFYKSSDFSSFVGDLKIEKFKFYDYVLNNDEVKLLYFEKYPPLDLMVDIEMGERNYIDTITRTFRHKMQGSKSNLINLVINDSLITDKQVQKRYELLLLKQLESVLPAYVKINSIKWKDNKDNNEKMLLGNFNTRNTLTNNIE